MASIIICARLRRRVAAGGVCAFGAGDSGGHDLLAHVARAADRALEQAARRLVVEVGRGAEPAFELVVRARRPART